MRNFYRKIGILLIVFWAKLIFAQSFTENFDNISTLAGSGWYQQNNSAPAGTNPVWFQGNPPSSGGPFIAYNGAENAYIACNFNSTAGGTGVISNWLLTPNRTFKNGDVITFYTRKYDVGQDYPDRMEVRLSTNGASTNVGSGASALGDFTTLLLSVNPSLIVGGYPKQWTQYTITISGLPAPTSGRLAFRYFVTAAGPTGTNSDYIGLDNVVYTSYTCPTFTMTASGALAGGSAGNSYSTALTQTGALGTPSFVVTAGALPPGLTLSSSGTISGTPTATGTFNFTATVSDASGCSRSQAYSITVVCPSNPITMANFPALCSNAGLYTLTEASPAGGIYSGIGVSGGQFDPVAGTQTITYDYTDPYGCAHTLSKTITVNTAPTVTLATFAETCSNGGVIALTGGLPAGGTYSGTGVSGGQFDPASGTQTITYTYTDANGCSASASKIITVNPTTVISTQPSASTICAGANTTFAVAASNATSYQWQVDQGAGFSNISNGAPYSGATTSNLTITTATAGLNGYLYRVVMTGQAGCSSAVSNNATLTVNSAPAITSQPSASTICAGANTTFTVAASNATGYQWQVDQGAGFSNISNGAPYSGATTATLTITNATAGLNGYVYRAIATGACTPNATSNSVALTINSAPAITSQPSASTICAGANTTFTATASDATGYQWQVDQGAGFSNISNGAPYSGATTATLTITNANAGLNGYVYRAIATGACTPNATSNSVALTINSAPAITSQPSASTICAGANTTFTVAASNATGYQWQVDQGAGFSNVSNGAPYSGATTATLTITNATAGLNGYVYRAIATGACTPNARSNSVALTINSAPAITSQPSASTICEGANTTFTATASDATGYQWQVDQGSGFTNVSNTAPYSGATTATLTITNATAGLNGYVYRAIATGACTPNATSESATLTVSSVTGSTTKTNVSCNTGSNGTITLTPSGGTAPYTFDWGNGIITQDRTGLAAGEYTVIIKDANGCTGSLSITITEPTALVATAGTQNNVACNGSATGSATVNVTGGTGAYTYSWSPSGGTAATASGLAAGEYVVTVTDANNCQTTQSFTITEAEAVDAPTGAATQTFEAGDTLSVLVATGEGIKWYATADDATNHINDLPLSTLIVNNTTYFATQTVGGCESKTSLAVLAWNEDLGVNNANGKIKIQIYPNPVREVLHFSGQDKINKIVIMSIDGKKVSEKTMLGERKLNVHTLIQGTYLIKIFTDKGVQTIKFIKN
ncbi:T9SS-dependent choice-of-anchor J family protein [Epilithonimonas xixisoli]|uniref:Putative secreted protein (Por secretion system target) n=1 Tax=Epilithonimonas xixisoli TaxID=1476462 RepID=A0A4R8I8L5_9FLAO|nr:choice-of-anchor J domain-containing protein [Epilithonimonas xixisoli]TDX86392.1 putative secreted protein (Por secretion system target) [Epilithonimonas xixisoli]